VKHFKTALLLTLGLALTLSPLHAGKFYVLCEGNFGQANASLWSIDENLQAVEGPLLWNASSNPLGDVGQSMTLFEDKLYIVMNGSHEIRIVDLGDQETHVGDIELPGASPRYMAIDESARRGYISSWTLGALIVVDMDTHALIDTFYTQALPEQILVYGEVMFVSIPMEGDWSASNKVLQISTANDQLAITHIHEVVEGPGALRYYDDKIYVTSLYYNDAWETFTGTSTISEIDGSVETMTHGSYSNYTADLDMIGNSDALFRTYGNSLVPLRSDLSLDTDNAIGDVSGIYTHFASQLANSILIGSTDFVAPDQVTVLSYNGQTELATFDVGALPSQIVYYTPGMVSIKAQDMVPTSFGLGHNYPNPFNPTTTIPFTLEHSGEVSLKIFNISGKAVATLYHGYANAGESAILWNGRNDAGMPVSSGIYHAVLTSNTGSVSIKLNLLK